MSMASSFNASFTLSLRDELSGGLRKIIADTKQLRELAKGLGFKPLEGADAIVNRVDRDVQQLNRSLGATARQAESAAGAVRRMGAAEIGRATAQASAQATQLRNLQAIGLTLSNQRSAAGQGFTMRGDAPFSAATAAPSLLRLGGPGGGGSGGGGGGIVPYGAYGAPGGPGGPIPLNIGPSLRTRTGNALSGVAGRMGALNNEVGLMGGMVAGLSLEAPIHAAAELDQTLRQIAILGAQHGAQASAEIARLRSTLGADSMETGQPIQQLAEAYMDLRSRGLSAEAVDKLLPVHSRAATAYHVSAESMGGAVAALNQNLRIPESEMGGALAAMAQATHAGKFSMADMSRYMPTIAGRMDTMGMRGRGNLDKAAAALAVVSRNSADPSATAVNFTDMMIAMTQDYARKAFKKKAGVDLQAIMIKAEKAGQDPMEAYIGILERMTRNVKGDVAKAFTLGKVLHNQQAGTAALSLLQHREDYIHLRDELHKIGADKLTRDYNTAMEGLKPELMIRAAKLKALEQQVGLGFAWTVPASSLLLGGIVEGLSWMNAHLPGVADGAFKVTGGMLALVAAMGVLGTVAGPIKAGFKMFSWVLAPLKLLNGLIGATGLAFAGLAIGAGAAALYIWRHWDQFRGNFEQMWAGLKQTSSGLGNVLAGAFTLDGPRVAAGFRQMWSGAIQYMDAMWGEDGTMKKLMTKFVDWLPEWGKNFANKLGEAMQVAYAGWGKFFSDLRGEMQSLTPVPSQPFMVPPNLNEQREWRYKPTTPGTPTTPGVGTGSGPAQRHPTAYETPAAPGATVQRVHVTFEADVPGRASIRHSDTAPMARGPMLARA